MPKDIYKLQGFHKGITGKWAGAVDNVAKQDDMEATAILQQANNVMIDSIGQIRPAGFWESKGDVWLEENHLVDYDIDNETTPVTFDVLSGYNAASKSYLEEGTYRIGYSFVFDDNNESVITDTNNIVTVNAGESIQMRVSVTTHSNIRKVRFYFKNDSIGSDWYYIITYDIINQNYVEYPETDLIREHQVEGVDINGLSPITYEAINGYKPDVDGLGLASAQDTTFTNGRVFAIDGDKIVYSQAGKTACFPRYNDGSGNILNPTESNSPGIAIESFGEMLVYFTEDDISYISVKGLPSQWSVVNVFKNQGIANRSQTITTETGILWINSNGCYYSGGQQPQDLSQNLNKQEWSEDFYTNNSSIGFIPNDNQVMVSDDTSYAIFDFRTQGWITGVFNLPVTAPKIVSGNKLLTKDINDIVYRWTNSPYIDDTGNLVHNTGESKIITNKINFGHPNYAKKIYRVMVTYANYETAQRQILLQFDSNVGGTQTDFLAEYTLAKSQPNYNPVVKTITYEIPTTEMAWCWLTLKFTGYIVIKNISIEYRILKGKRV